MLHYSRPLITLPSLRDDRIMHDLETYRINQVIRHLSQCHIHRIRDREYVPQLRDFLFEASFNHVFLFFCANFSKLARTLAFFNVRELVVAVLFQLCL